MTTTSGCPRCGGEWVEIGPRGWQCERGHFRSRAEAEAVDSAAEEIARAGPLPASGAVLVPLNRVLRRKVRWLWRGRIPLGKLTVLDGDPDLGKSFITLDLAARVSRGWAMPDGSASDEPEPAGVVLLSAEDDLEDTIGPRLDALGADSDRIVALQAVRSGPDGAETGVSLADLPAIEEAIQRVGARLVIIDPLMAYLPAAVDAHHDADVRRVLKPLAELAARLHVAILVVRHLNKSGGGNPLYRGGGSIGIIGAARAGLMVAADPDDESGQQRILAVTKSNLSGASPSLRYEIVERDGETVVAWGGACDMTPRALLRETDDEGHSAVTEALAFLKRELSEGPQPAKATAQAARDAGISEPTLRRARHRLSVQVTKTGFASTGKWEWSLPETPVRSYAESAQNHASAPYDDQPNGKAPYPHSDHLNDVLDAESAQSTNGVQPTQAVRVCPVHQTELDGQACWSCHESYCAICGRGTGHELWRRCETCTREGRGRP